MPVAWYVLHVKPHKERFVFQRLIEAGEQSSLMPVAGHSLPIEAYFPSVRVKPKNPRAAKIRPFFPGYLFVHVDLDELGDNAFSWIPGAHGLVRFGGEPAVVHDTLIAELKQRVAEIDAAGGLAAAGFKKGDPVRVISGPLAGYDAIFDMQLPGKDRVQVLLSFLSSHPQRVQLDPADLAKVKKS